jgi:hypothetical protein
MSKAEPKPGKKPAGFEAGLKPKSRPGFEKKTAFPASARLRLGPHH